MKTSIFLLGTVAGCLVTTASWFLSFHAPYDTISQAQCIQKMQEVASTTAALMNLLDPKPMSKEDRDVINAQLQ